MYFSLPGMTTMLPKVLEIERHQLADYARVDYAITKGEDEMPKTVASDPAISVKPPSW